MSALVRSLAVVGATGAVGRIVLDEIQRQGLTFDEIRLIASPRSAGKQVDYAGRKLSVVGLSPEAFDGVDLVIASTPDEVAAQFVPWAVERGCVVVDESAQFRMDPAVPLVVPEVNPEDVTKHRGIISSPNCSTTQMVVALHPLRQRAGLKRVIVSTYQAVSGAGLAAQQELREATRSALEGQSTAPENFQYNIAFNLIPQIGSAKFAGFTSEEMKMVRETHKIFGDDSIAINATCVRVPVFVGHSESIYCETEEPLELEEVRELFRTAPGIQLVDDLDARQYPMPVDCVDRPEVFIGRVRKDLDNPCGISFWCVSDNLRKGAATNAVQIGKLVAQQTAAARS